jgi:hypothetical protein
MRERVESVIPHLPKETGPILGEERPQVSRTEYSHSLGAAEACSKIWKMGIPPIVINWCFVAAACCRRFL